MKKAIVLITLTILFGQLNAQECLEITKENTKLKEELSSLKKALLLTDTQNKFQAKDINVQLVSVDGDKRNQTIKIEILFTNSGVNIDKFTTNVKSIIELGGNEVLLDKALLGAKEYREYTYTKTELYRDTPLKCTYLFKGVVPETTVIKALPLPFSYHKEGTKYGDYVKDRVIFRDIKINWM